MKGLILCAVKQSEAFIDNEPFLLLHFSDGLLTETYRGGPII
ncbi:hypothetical protein [Paenibacillus terrigena]|nr:hypothetical protein [Paenibacillus terrigena]